MSTPLGVHALGTRFFASEARSAGTPAPEQQAMRRCSFGKYYLNGVNLCRLK
jgi:hypothetical protein